MLLRLGLHLSWYFPAVPYQADAPCLAERRPSAGRVVQRLMAIASKYGKGAVAAAAARGATNQEL